MNHATPKQWWTTSLEPRALRVPRDESGDEFDTVEMIARPAGASAKVVFPSVFLLAALGTGAFTWMYLSVHAGERRDAAVGAASPQAEAPWSAPSAARPRVAQTATPVADGTAAAAAAWSPLPERAVTLAPVTRHAVAEESKPSPSTPATARGGAPVRSAVTVRIEPDPVSPAHTDASPYDNTSSATPPASPPPRLVYLSKTRTVVRVEPNPVNNPYEPAGGGDAERTGH
jgi:hypothetical protein